MKGLFPPISLSLSDKGVGSGSDLLPSDADVSMDDSHASSMSGITTESIAIGSPPRTQRRKRNTIGLRSIAGPTTSLGSIAPGAVASSRSRLFQDDVDLKPNNGNTLPRTNHESSFIMKPLDLNQEFSESVQPSDNKNDKSATFSRLSDSSPTRDQNNSIIQKTSKTPFPPRRDRNATMALRKRQAEQHDLYGKVWSHDVSNGEDAFSAVESPVDMYTSPGTSPSTPGRGNSRHENNTKSFTRLPIHRSPFYSKHQQQHQGRHQQLQYHKSPSHFQTLDGRTVQSKNPFSPMIFDETPTPTPGKSLPPGNSPAPGKNGTLGLTHPLLLTTDSLTFPTNSLNGEDSGSEGKSHLVLRHKLQKRGTSPCNVGRSIKSENMDMDCLTRDGFTPFRGNAMSDDENKCNKKCQLEQKSSMYIRDGYPEQTGRYSFTGSPIKENFASTSKVPSPIYNGCAPKPASYDFSTGDFPTVKESERNPQEQDFCTNIHKIRRRSKGDDVVAAAAQGESSWKKEGMYIKTNSSSSDSNSSDPFLMNFNNVSGLYNQSYYNKHNHQETMKSDQEDSISPTDVLNFPRLRASPSDTSTVPPAPSKPIRRPPIRRYTPIRKPTGPPPTPMPGARQSRSFDFENVNNDNVFNGSNFDGGESSDDNGDDDRISNAQRRRQNRRPKSGPTMDFLKLSPRMGARENTAPPPSRFYSDFDVIAELGSGSFGNVFKVLSRLDGCFYAIKVAHRVAKGNADRDRMLKEVYALAALSDQADTATFHIVRYHQAWMEEQRLYIQTELCTTTLQAEMQQAAPSQLSFNTRYKCLREILLALEFIHKNGMVHLDIKPENIFLKNDQFKLGDFGLVSKVSSHDVEEGDSRYMSMELLSGDHADLTKSDIFSLGIAMYEVCFGCKKTLPSNGPEWQSLRSGSIIPPPNTTDELFQIIKKMMNPTYRERPFASDLLKLPELLSEEQKMLFREREKVEKANQALAAQSKMSKFLRPPKPAGLVRRNTWSAFS